jgi:transposase
VRADLVAKLEELIDGSDKLTPMKRGELRGRISTKPGLNRFLRVTPGGKLRVDKTKMKTEANLDGKYLLRCSDPKLSAEDLALGYKQLLEVERGWRDMKSVLDLRPVYHRLEERIRAHVLLCWLALLLIRIAETTTGQTWQRGPPGRGSRTDVQIRQLAQSLLAVARAPLRRSATSNVIVRRYCDGSAGR